MSFLGGDVGIFKKKFFFWMDDFLVHMDETPSDRFRMSPVAVKAIGKSVGSWLHACCASGHSLYFGFWVVL